ncbi:uncharacterized protein LOC144874791 [Branchiostoma floridae x Branchiostoma japonicum]
MSSHPPKLRFITYLCPSIPVEYFETIIYYLGDKLGCDVSLLYESRFSGPPADSPDPFSLNEVDIGFMCSSPFLKLLESKANVCELLPAAPLAMHPKNSGNRPVYFSDVIVHKDNVEKYPEFKNLRGARWAYNEPTSLSGCLSTLSTLKKMGENANFFGHSVQSGSHLKSLQMVLNHTVDGAAIDSFSLMMQKAQNLDLEKNIQVIESWGPYPIQPLVFRSGLDVELKQKVTQTLLEAHADPEMRAKLGQFGISKFVPINMSLFDRETQLQEDVKGLTSRPAYY